MCGYQYLSGAHFPTMYSKRPQVKTAKKQTAKESANLIIKAGEANDITALTASQGSMFEGSTREPIKVEVVNIDNNKSMKENPLTIRKRKSSR